MTSCFSEVAHCLQTTEPGNLKTDALRDFLGIIGNLLLICTFIYNMCSNTTQCMVSNYLSVSTWCLFLVLVRTYVLD